MEGGGSKPVAFRLGRLHLEKTKLYGSARRKLFQAQVSQGSTRGIQQPGRVPIPKPAGTPIKMPKKSRSKESTPVYTLNPPKKPRDSAGRGTYGEAVTKVRTVIVKEDYPEDKLSEEDQEFILADFADFIAST
jgi:hypothetical protein